MKQQSCSSASSSPDASSVDFNQKLPPEQPPEATNENQAQVQPPIADPAVQARIKTELLALVHRYDHVTFAEVSMHIDGTRGNFALYLPNNDSVMIWSGLSAEAIGATDELIREKLIHFRPTDLLVYLADGELLRLPVAKTVRKYAKPHWLPMVISVGWYSEKKGRKSCRK